MANIRFTGNLAADPELKYLAGGSAVAKVRVGHTPRKKDPNGQYVDHGVTQWYTVELWGTSAEDCAEALNKGDRVNVEGELVHETWQTTQGEERTSHTVKYATISLPVKSSKPNNAPARSSNARTGDQWATDPAGNLSALMGASDAPF